MIHIYKCTVLIPAIRTSESKEGPKARIWRLPNIVLLANQLRNLPSDTTEVSKPNSATGGRFPAAAKPIGPPPNNVIEMDAFRPASTELIEPDNEEDQSINWDMFPRATYQAQATKKSYSRDEHGRTSASRSRDGYRSHRRIIYSIACSVSTNWPPLKIPLFIYLFVQTPPNQISTTP